ncbi:hypothetical protein CRENBAI_020668 [Crenichthys baileyi]|uniref:Uncharacterized protein n=1 Tax=Crenichthys baileyi TaxID=28760 RepID=A0AAV9RZN2_9TELE
MRSSPDFRHPQNPPVDTASIPLRTSVPRVICRLTDPQRLIGRAMRKVEVSRWPSTGSRGRDSSPLSRNRSFSSTTLSKRVRTDSELSTKLPEKGWTVCPQPRRRKPLDFAMDVFAVLAKTVDGVGTQPLPPHISSSQLLTLGSAYPHDDDLRSPHSRGEKFMLRRTDTYREIPEVQRRQKTECGFDRGRWHPNSPHNVSTTSEGNNNPRTVERGKTRRTLWPSRKFPA